MLAALLPRSANFRNFRRVTVYLTVSGLFWLAGGWVDGATRLPLWLVALGIEYAAPLLYFRVPGLGRSVSTDWKIEGGHLAERCGLFVIIVLGEAILDTGATAAGLDWSGVNFASFATAFLGSVAMWWIYFNIGAERASHLIIKTDDPGRLARLAYNYLHLPIIGGIIVDAAADELVLNHPQGPLAPAAAAIILSGPALFLFGNLLFKRATGGPWQLSHLVGLAGMAGLVALMPIASPLIVSAAATAVLLLVATWETLSLRSAAH
jgi:low temperature requirement protein LtrA